MWERTGERWKWVVMVAVYAGIVILSASVFMAGILYVAILNKYHGDTAMSSLIVSFNAGFLSLLGPLASIVVDRWSCRVSMVTGAVLLTLSGLCSAFVNSLDWLFVTYGLLGGIGNSLVSVPFSITLGFYFNKRRHLVIALSTAVIGLGMFIASPVALYFLENLSLDETFLAIGALNIHLCIVGFICRPSAQEQHIHAAYKRTQIEHDDSTLNHKKIRKILKSVIFSCNFRTLSNIPFLLFLLSTLTWNVMLSICLLHLPNYASVLGASDFEITLLMTCFSISNTSGRFLSALTVVRPGLDIVALHILSLGILGVVTVTYPFYSIYDVTKCSYVFAVISGLLTGAPNSLMTPITLDMVGLDNLSAAHGLEYFFSGMGFLAGPPIAGFLYGRTGTYKNSFMFAGCINLCGGFLALAARLKVGQQEDRNTPKEMLTSDTFTIGDSVENELLGTAEQSKDSAIAHLSDT